MNKRGQVTIFIILGIIIVAIISFVIFFSEEILKRPLEPEKITLPPKIQNIQNHVQNCLELTAPTGLYVLGLQGGYIIPPDNSLETEFSKIAYGYFQGKDILVKKPKMELEVSDYINLFLPLCTDFSEFPEFTIRTKEINTETSIFENSVSITVNYPLEIISETETFKLNQPYFSDFNIRLGLIHNTSKQIVANLIKNPDEIDLTYLLDTGMDIDILPIDENILVYSLTDPNSEVDNVTYTFMFANKLS